MKKAILALALAVGFTGMAFADAPDGINGNDNVVLSDGTVEPISVGEIWDLAVDGYAISSYDMGTPATTDDTTHWRPVGTSLDFRNWAQWEAEGGGDPDVTPPNAGQEGWNLIDSTPGAIAADTSLNYGTTTVYPSIPHLAAPGYVDARVYVSNNVHNNFRVALAVESDWVDGTVVPPTDGGTVPAYGQSCMHITLGLLDAGMDAGAVTSSEGETHMRSTTNTYTATQTASGTSYAGLANYNGAMPNSQGTNGRFVPIPIPDASQGAEAVLYDSTAGTAETAPMGDAFLGWIALDYLPIDIATGDYDATGGSVTWTLYDIDA